jgi:hypothetical protein
MKCSEVSAVKVLVSKGDELVADGKGMMKFLGFHLSGPEPQYFGWESRAGSEQCTAVPAGSVYVLFWNLIDWVFDSVVFTRRDRG